MANDNDINIKIGVDTNDNNIKSSLKSTEGKVKKAGKKAGQSYSKGFDKGTSSIFGLKSKIIAALGTVGVAAFTKKVVDAAIIQEEAVNDLNIALKASGQFSVAASKDLQDYASSLQKVTTFGDEATLSAASLIQSLGQLDKEALKGATKAAQDLSAALGIDLQSAATLVGKAAAGEVGSFSRYGLSIKKGADNAETFANALDKINGKFGSAAQGKVNTFSGAVTQLSNSYSDALENIGEIITKSTAFTAVIKLGNKAVTNAGDAIKKFGESIDPIEIINKFIDINNALITYIVAPLEMLYNVAKTVFNYAVMNTNMWVAALGKLGGALATVGRFLGQDGDIVKGLETFSESSEKVFRESAKDFKDSFNSITDFPIADKLSQKNEELRNALVETVQAIQEEKENLDKAVTPDPKVVQAKEALVGFGDFYKNFLTGLKGDTKKPLDDINKDFAKFSATTGSNLMKGLGTAAGSAFSAFGKALKEGENGLQAFSDAFLSSIGDMLVQEGTSFILKGLAYTFIPGLEGNGSGLISAGAAMAAFGGFLGATGGSAGAGATSGGAGSGGVGEMPVTTDLEDIAKPEEIVEASPSQNIKLVVEGNFYETEETAKSLLDLLNENFEKNNSVVTGARFA